MDNNVPVSKEIAQTIIKLCFDVNELKHLFDSGTPTSVKHLFECHEEIKNGIDKLIGSVSVNQMAKNVQESKNFVNNTLKMYKCIQLQVDNKSEIMEVLEKLDTDLTDLQNQIKDQLK